MRLLRFVPIKLTIFLVLGIVLQNYLDLNLAFCISLSLSLLVVLGLSFFFSKKRDSISFGVLTMITTISIGILSVCLWSPKNRADHYSHQIKTKTTTTFRLQIREVLKSNSFSDRYVARVNEVNGQKSSGKIIIAIRSDSISVPLQVDEEIITLTKLQEVKKPLNPNQFDYRNYLEKQGIYHQLRVSQESYFVSRKKNISISGLAASLRQKIIAKLSNQHFKEEELSIIQALFLGQRTDISEATYENYKNAGAVHILAISGLHVGVLLALLQFLLRPIHVLPYGRTITLILSVLLLWGFTFLAGFSASVVRAVTMFSFVAYALYLNRPSNTYNILALSMFFILLVINPMLLFQVGFQMSYAAVFTIIWVYPLLQKTWHPKNKFILKLWQLFSVSIAAQLGVLPISLFYFHQFPGLFFISNLLIVPFLGIILSIGILVILLALLNILPDSIAILFNRVIRTMNLVVEWIADKEIFIFRNISFDSVQLILSYAIIVGLLFALTRISFRRTVALLCSIIVYQVWMYHKSLSNEQQHKLLLLHQLKNTVLVHHKGNLLSVYSRSNTAKTVYENYETAKGIRSTSYDTLKNSYRFQNKKLIILDSTGIYTSSEEVAYLLITQSPKINFERVLDSLKPHMVLADGSNFKSDIERWKASCLERKLPFHDTGEKGAFYFE